MTTESTHAHEAATDVAPVWRPSPEYISGSHIERLIRALGIDLDVRNPEPAYDALYRRSITAPDEFWRKTFELLGVEWFQPFIQVADTSAGIQFPKWFVCGKLNLSHNAVFRHLRGMPCERFERDRLAAPIECVGGDKNFSARVGKTYRCRLRTVP